ncbi:hypothetical protein [Desulfosporosinus sp. SB140]|uniref:hypothetical protein n=1 Tax=Desulfosporosinus paludis TaxID=3115649 RepID=UPI00388D9A77
MNEEGKEQFLIQENIQDGLVALTQQESRSMKITIDFLRRLDEIYPIVSSTLARFLNKFF